MKVSSSDLKSLFDRIILIKSMVVKRASMTGQKPDQMKEIDILDLLFCWCCWVLVVGTRGGVTLLLNSM